MNSTYIKITLIIFTSIFLLSCKKDSIESSGLSKITLSFSNDSFDQDPSNKSNSSKSLSPTAGEQTIITKTNTGIDVKATLIPITSFSDEISINQKASNSVTTVKRELQENTKLKVLVYNSGGVLFTEINHTYKANGPSIVVDNMLVGQSYTFVVYSINSTANIPEPQQKQSLSGLQINDLSTQFMYYKEVKTIAAHANNTLKISLKHQFSEISTVLTVDQTGDLAGSKVTQMTPPTISPAYQKAGFNLSSGVPIFQQSDLIQNGKALNLAQNAITTNPIITSPVLLLTNGTNSTFNVNSLTINNYTKAIKLEGINLVPGVRYTLKLEVACPCLQDITVGDAISRTEYNAVASTFTFTNANYGAILDIYDIDNSFNLRVNNTYIFSGTSQRISNGNTSYPVSTTNEIQFQGYGLYGNPSLIPNIEFEDGSRWGVNSFGEIWHFKDASRTKPIIRIIISEEGNVQMFGSKTLTGGPPLYPLRIVNNKNVAVTEDKKRNYFPYEKYTETTTHTVKGNINKVDWTTTSNVILLSQSRKDAGDATSFNGSITGKRVIKCTP